MLIKEIFDSADSVVNDILNDIMDLLVIYRQLGHDHVPFKGKHGLLTYLSKRGHLVDIESLMNLDISNLPKFSNIVTRIDPGKITIKPSMNASQINKDELDKSKEKVAKGASAGAKKIVKSGGKV